MVKYLGKQKVRVHLEAVVVTRRVSQQFSSVLIRARVS
jgi:hypothetical protein